jgi:heparan-sulfate lyase
MDNMYRRGKNTGIFLITLCILFSVFESSVSALPVEKKNIETLISRLDADMKGMERVMKSADNPQKASRELLTYYRQRKWVKHPVSRISPDETTEDNADENDVVTANNALNHIFVGQPAYPPFFCGDDIDWGTRPVPDNEWVWQLNRMSFWDAMARVYVQTRDEKYAREWGEQLIDWVHKNPNDEEHRYAWRSIEAGIRGYRWTGLFQRFIDSPSFTPEVLVAFLNSCYDHAEFLMTRYSTGSNWGLMEAEGMAFIAITFPEFKNSETWKQEAFRRLNHEINIQVYPDGHQRELAMGYHLGCIGWFLRTYELAEMNGMKDAFSDSYLERIEKMCEVPLKLCHPDGTNAQFGDAWAGTPGQHDDRFREWAELFGREDFLYLATGGEEGIAPDSTAYALPVSGLYSLRSGWSNDAVNLVLKCGPDGGGHSQPDNGTFELFAGGRNLMPDAGSYIYSGNPEGRAWFRQTKVHQTLTLNGQNSGYNPRLILWQPSDSLDVLVVENNSYEGLTHRRSVFFADKQYFVIVDEATGTATGDVDVHFQLAPGKMFLNQDSLSVTSGFEEGWNVLVQAYPQEGLAVEDEEGWVSFKYTIKEPRPAFRYRLQKGQDQEKVQFVTFVVPYEGAKPELEVQKVIIENQGMELEVVCNGRQKTLGYKIKGQITY